MSNTAYWDGGKEEEGPKTFSSLGSQPSSSKKNRPRVDSVSIYSAWGLSTGIG